MNGEAIPGGHGGGGKVGGQGRGGGEEGQVGGQRTRGMGGAIIEREYEGPI
jgi:hypothetical protein